MPLKMTRRMTLTCASAAVFSALAMPAYARSAVWAEPVDLAGVPNLHRVTARLFRSAQPNAIGFQGLAALGVKTVINLRQLVDDAPMAKGTGLIVRRVPMKSRFVGEDNAEKMVQALRFVRQSMRQGPVLVHCRHGADRTGAVMAVYRILYQDWTRDAALDELTGGGYGFHAVWANIPRFVANCDLSDIKRRVNA